MKKPFDLFNDVKDEFMLGNLTTESFNLKSSGLASLAKNDLKKALSILKEIDQDALNQMKGKVDEVYKLSQKIKKTVEQKNKVFLVGCGATGRLSLTIESLFRNIFKREDIVSFMAGGDYALIKSVESFEDSASFGGRQLQELLFGADDLLIAITEGGETNFVIGACMKASEISSVKPHFLYCNPKEELMPLKRCRDLFNNQKIDKLELVVGGMALSGSTRMQATTVQMFVTSFAIENTHLKKDEFKFLFQRSIEELNALSYDALYDFIILEADQYLRDGHITYQAQKLSGLTILTDTTERSPTFSLESFEKVDDHHFSLSYLVLDQTHSSKEAWRDLLGRAPRGLNWNDQSINLTSEEIYKFDISLSHLEKREKNLKNLIFVIDTNEEGFLFKLSHQKEVIPFKTQNRILKQIALKMLLNAHSTLVMGRLSRYESNVMTWVRASNLKLIDRAVRYVLYLGKEKGVDLNYDEVSAEVIKLAQSGEKGPVVLLALSHFMNA